MRREGLQARGIYKEVPRPSRGLALATRQKIPYTYTVLVSVGDLVRLVFTLESFSKSGRRNSVSLGVGLGGVI